MSASFLGISSLISSRTQDGVRGPCGVVHQRAKFFEKNGESRASLGFLECIGKFSY